MTCDSRARRASRRLLLTALLAAAATVACAQAPAPWPPRLEPVGSAVADPSLRGWFEEDRGWLARQPAHLLLVPDASDSGLAAWLQRAAQLQAPAPVTVDTASTVAADTPVTGQRDLSALLRDRWLERGHLAATVTMADVGDSVRSAVIVVDPGPRFRLGVLTVEGDDFPGRQALLDAWRPRPGDALATDTYTTAAAGVVAGCAERGFPFPQWLTREVTVHDSNATVDITAVLVPGARAVIGPQASNLPDGRGEHFLLRTAGLQRGRPFRESDLRRGIDRLLVRDLYERVDEPLVHLTTARDTVGVLWRVTPMERPNRVNVMLGLSREQEGGTRLSGQVDLALPNLAGTGRALTAAWSDDGQDRSRFGFTYLEPLILGTPLDTDLSLENEVLTDVYTRFTAENRWRLPVVSLWGVEIGLGWDRTTYPEGDLERTSRLRGRAAVLHSRGDRARSGWSGTFAIETASRSTTLRPPETEDESTSTAQLGSQDNQRLYEVDLSGELWLRPTVSLAARTGFRQNDADVRPVPLSEQYYYGGANTLRGYRENEFHGETVAYGGIELRLGRARRARVYTFVDVGYFEFSTRADGTADGPLLTRDGTQTGFGLGLMTRAAAGHLNLAVGFPGDIDFETAKLHVSLLGSF